MRKHWRRRIPGVLEVDEHAIDRLADYEIEIVVAVEIDKCGAAVPTDVDLVERVRASSPCHERRRRRIPCVIEVVEQAAFISHYEVQVAVIVEVSERRGALIANVDAVEGVCASGPSDEQWRSGCPGVFKIVEHAILIAHYEVQVTVIVDVSEHGGAIIADVDAVEGPARHLPEPVRVAPADGRVGKLAVRCAVHRKQQHTGEAPGCPGAARGAFPFGAASHRGSVPKGICYDAELRPLAHRLNLDDRH